MTNLKTDKRIKYNLPSTIYMALDCKYGYDFKLVTKLRNELNQKCYLAFEFYEGYAKVNLKQLEHIKDILSKAYPKSEYKIISRHLKNLPEVKDYLLCALCR